MAAVPVLFVSRKGGCAGWQAALARHTTRFTLHDWASGQSDLSGYRYALAWHPPHGVLKNLPGLKAILSLGAGIESILADPGMPRHIPLIRLVDPDLTGRMVEYVVLHVLLHHRQMTAYLARQREQLWAGLPQPPARVRRVGFLGFGALSRPPALQLKALGFQVAAWSRVAKSDVPEGISHTAGPDALEIFLQQTDILVCLLPHTDETAGLLNAARLARLPKGAAVINAGRGSLIDEAALLAALDSGQVGAASLDVFQTEPLPREHPFWGHERVILTPHGAADTDPEATVPGLIAAMEAVERGQTPPNMVDLSRGY